MRAVEHVVRLFPGRDEAVRRLYLRDELFRSIAEDLALSVASLRRFERHPDACLRPEVDDYRNLVGELEDELRAYLDRMDGH
jgi:hypothetical protein